MGGLIVLLPVLRVLNLALEIIKWTVFIWVILSWIVFFTSQSSFRWRNRRGYDVLMQLNDILSRMAYPFLKPIRRLLHRFDTAGIDWSPLVLLLIIFLLQELVQIGERAILFP